MFTPRLALPVPPRALCLAAVGIVLAACAGPTQVIITDFSQVSGVYLITYGDRADIRERLEGQFAEELERAGREFRDYSRPMQ